METPVLLLKNVWSLMPAVMVVSVVVPPTCFFKEWLVSTVSRMFCSLSVFCVPVLPTCIYKEWPVLAVSWLVVSDIGTIPHVTKADRAAFQNLVRLQ